MTKKPKPTEMSLSELAKTLTGALSFHLNQGSKGHTLVQKIADPAGKVIGGKRTFTVKGKQTVVYFLGEGVDKQFETGERFLKAYQQQLRDEEFEKPQPEKKCPQ